MTRSAHSLGWAFNNVKGDCSPLGTSMSSASAVRAQEAQGAAGSAHTERLVSVLWNESSNA
jgi:hypothetical protein